MALLQPEDVIVGVVLGSDAAIVGAAELGFDRLLEDPAASVRIRRAS